MSIYRVAFEGTHGGCQTVNVWHVSGPASLEGAIVAALATDPATEYANACSSAWSGVGITATDIVNKTQAFWPLTLPGTQSANSMPPNVAAVITWKTDKVGRKYRGRTYMPGLDKAAADHGVVAAGQITCYETFVTELIAALEGIGAQLVVYHRGDGTYTPVTSHKVRTVTHVQRRRTLGYGS